MVDKIKLSVNRQARGKPSAEEMRGKYSAQFVNETLTPEELMEVLTVQGHPIAPSLTRRWRAKENFESVQAVLADFDRGEYARLDTLAEHPYVKKWGYGGYTTPSDTPDNPRSRAVFILSEPITDPDLYRRCYIGWSKAVFGNAPDPQTKDPARQWFGSPGARTFVYGNILPIEEFLKYADSAPPENREEYAPLGGKLERGSRNDNLYHSALGLARQGADRDFIVIALEKWLEDQHQFDVTRDEVEKAVDSAVKAAKARPIELEDKSDTLAAELFIRQHGADLFYVSGIGWHFWDGRVWVPDYEEVIVTQKFIETMRKVQADAAARIASSRSKADMKEAASTASWALKYLSARALSAALGIASKLPGMRKTADEIDGADTLWLLNVRNGTIDLRTGELYPHRKTDYITKMVDVDYDPTAEAPFWESTLKLIFENHERLITYVQRAFGYTLTGTQDERCFFIAWGESGANGKSTVLETVQDLLGPYAKMSDMSVLASRESNNHTRASLAVLQGTRFVSVNEAEEHQKLLESLIKQLTGGDTVQAEYKYKNPFEYKPAFKIWIRTNEKPVIRSQNNAIWDRIKLIPFERQIPKDKRLPRSEVDKRLREEFPGILAWMVRGCLDWQKNGLQEPEEVTKAVDDYRVESDIVRAFADECVVEAPSKRLPTSSAYQAFVWWCKEGGEKYVMTKTKFTRRMRALGYEVDRVTTGTVIQGVELTPAASMFMV